VLTDATRRQLQRLRFLLEEALARTQDSTDIGRHSALVLLDGACEYAMSVALGHLGQQIERQFPQKFDALKKARPEWKPDTWSSVMQLHRARNDAQHHGTVAAASYMPSWAAQAQRFIDSLVQVTFEVELRTILVADAVESEDVRRLLVEAEKALEQQDASAAFDAAVAGFDFARGAWRGQRSEAIGRLTLAYSGLSQLGGAETDPTNVSLLRFEDLLEVQPFAPDVAEYHWLLARRGEAKEKLAPSLDVAQRAFLFVLAWVLRWEAFAARYEARRYPPPAPPYEPPVTGADHPVIYDTVVETQHHVGDLLDQPTLENVRYTVRVTLADIPDGERELWAQQVGDVLNERIAERGFDHVGAANVNAGGVVRFHGVSSQVTGDEIQAWIARALSEGDRRYRQKLSERQERAARLPSLRARFEEAMKSVEADQLVIGVTSDERDDGSFWVGVQFRRDETDPMLGHIFDGVAQSARSGRASVDYFDTALWFQTDFDPTEAAALIETIIVGYREQAATRQRGLAEVEARRGALEAELRNKTTASGPRP
jgi:hypothetical protein